MIACSSINNVKMQQPMLKDNYKKNKSKINKTLLRNFKTDIVYLKKKLELLDESVTEFFLEVEEYEKESSNRLKENDNTTIIDTSGELPLSVDDF